MAKTISSRCPNGDCGSTRITTPIDGDYFTCAGCSLYHYAGDRR